MKLRQICELLDARTLCLSDESCLDRDFFFVSATDLMSDALALVESDSHHTFLVTGLVHAQSLRTAEMLDINVVMYIRGKAMSDDDCALAKEMSMNVFSTGLSMYDTCGLLFREGLVTATRC